MQLYEDTVTQLIVHAGHKHYHDAYYRPWTQLPIFMKLTGLVSMQIALEAAWLLSDNEGLPNACFFLFYYFVFFFILYLFIYSVINSDILLPPARGPSELCSWPNIWMKTISIILWLRIYVVNNNMQWSYKAAQSFSASHIMKWPFFYKMYVV